MRITTTGIILVLLFLLTNTLSAQTADSVALNEIIEADTIVAQETPYVKVHFPRKATMYSAVLPGLGQIYNRQWWKVPIIYGGFVGLGMAIQWNHNYYTSYKQAYIDMNDGNLETDSYKELPILANVNELGSHTSENQTAQTRFEYYNRQRDLLIIGTVGFYLLNILDANVNAHFLDFDISEDLSLHFEPVGNNPYTNAPLLGASLSYNF
ncbi:DUF5683 domain-containing protein [Roseimarinus sediminis]|uniref:DUF5683 domain-containing protein n=1 Tax=Roseimarinus sediminis TaxID=1610899 RepID=UPI003D24FAB9